MKTSLNSNIIIFALCLGFFSWSSCKEKTVIPADLIPPVDNIHTFGLEADFFDPALRPGVFDSARTDDYLNYFAGIGKITNDPFFGTMTSGLYIQFAPQTTFFNFPKGFTLDSAVISLTYYKSYGDSTNPFNNYQYLNVYKVTESFNQSDAHYSNQHLMHDNNPVGGGASSLASISDSFVTVTDTFTHQLKIRLNDAFAQSIVQANSSVFNSSGSFFEFLQGLYIAPKDTSAVQNRVSYFKLNGDNTHPVARINFYMHDDTGRQSVIYFPFSTIYSAFFTDIHKDYTTTPAAGFLSGTANRDSVLIQGYPGFYTDITLNNLNKIPPSVINKAQLVITALPVGADGIYAPPSRLYLEKVDPSGSITLIADLLGGDTTATQSGLDFVNGNAKSVTINGKNYVQYQLNFPQELQNDILQGDTTLTLRIRAANVYPGAFRMVAAGPGGNADTKLKINIIYTKIN